MRGRPSDGVSRQMRWGLNEFTNLDDTLLDINRAIVLVANPGNTTATKGSNTHTEDTAKNRVGSGDGETEASSESKIDRRGNDGADHTEHEKLRLVLEGADVDNLGSDSVGNTATDTEGTSELHGGGTDHGLEVGDGPRRDGAGPRVGDIVGTDVPTIKEGEDCADGKEVVVLGEDGHCIGLCPETVLD